VVAAALGLALPSEPSRTLEMEELTRTSARTATVMALRLQQGLAEAAIAEEAMQGAGAAVATAVVAAEVLGPMDFCLKVLCPLGVALRPRVAMEEMVAAAAAAQLSSRTLPMEWTDKQEAAGMAVVAEAAQALALMIRPIQSKGDQEGLAAAVAAAVAINLV
jgi:hypothetical protein